MSLSKRLALVVGAALLVAAGPAFAQSRTLHLGLVGIMTGPNAQNGEFCRNGAQLAIDEINAAGGVRLPDGGSATLELVVVDDQAKPDIGLNAIRKLASDERVLAFLGPDFSGITLPSLFVGAEAGLPQITSSIGAKVTQSGYTHVFRGRSNDVTWMKALVDYAVGDRKAKSVGVSFTNIELGRSGRDVAVAYLKEKYGIEPVVDVSHGFGDRDLTASAARIVQAKPDLLINWGTQIEAALLLKELRNLGWKGTFAFNAADDIFVGLAKETAAGVIGPQNWVWTKDDAGTTRFVREYERRHGKKPSPHSIVYYDGVRLLAQAIEKGGASRKAIMAYLHGLDRWQGVQGTYVPSAKGGDISTATVIIRYTDELVPQVVASYP
ncbi:MAG TPA: ABC transporter substrate-binding protein [Thermodesulfobacteriota bacterium]